MAPAGRRRPRPSVLTGVAGEFDKAVALPLISAHNATEPTRQSCQVDKHWATQDLTARCFDNF